MQKLHKWDLAGSNQDIKFANGAMINDNEEFKIAMVSDNVLWKNEIEFLPEQIPGHFIKVMVGLCDKKIRKERGLLLQDKSFVGHGMYLLYSIMTNSFVFSHWDMDANYNEGGFIFISGKPVSLRYQDSKLIIKQEQKTFELKIEHHDPKDLFFCAVIGAGSVKIQQ